MSGYCKHCDTLTNSIVKIYDGKTLVWTGCSECYEKYVEVKRMTKDDLNSKIEFIEKMKKENPQGFEFLARGATDLLQKIEENKQKEKKKHATVKQ